MLIKGRKYSEKIEDGFLVTKYELKMSGKIIRAQMVISISKEGELIYPNEFECILTGNILNITDVLFTKENVRATKANG